MALATGCVAVCFLAAIIITITNKDGSKSTIKLNEGVAAEIHAAPGSKVTLTQSDKNTRPQFSWRDWPADAPKPAVAPFDVAQAKKHQEAWASYLKVPVEYTNSIGMKFRLIPPGEFVMGSSDSEIKDAMELAEIPDSTPGSIRFRSEAPQHKVILTQPFYLGVCEVTQFEYETIMGANPSTFKPTGPNKRWADKVAGMDTSRFPVESCTWNDAAEFCAKLSQREQLKPFYFRVGDTITPLKGMGYRLPSEAEWEFACRAGTTTKFWFGNQDEEMANNGWVVVNSDERPHATGDLPANPFGLHDTHGNVWEFVQDRWVSNYYDQFVDDPAIDPRGPFSAAPRMVRGGNWWCAPTFCRAAMRSDVPPDVSNYGNGFRVSLVVDAVREAQKSRAAITWHYWPAEAPLISVKD